MAISGPHVRLVAVLLLFLLLCSPAGVSATSQYSLTSHAFQDLGDDDGDGIPNYLDPDDNDDGITDEDTPPPDSSVEDDEGNEPPASDNGEPKPSNPESGSSGEQTSEEPQAQPQNQVTSLPNTGAGHVSPAFAFVLIAVGGSLVAFFAGVWLSRSHSRKL